MPTYEYICEACGNEFEKFQSMSADPVKKCPKCGKNKVQRKISVGGGIIFKGGGFYETDYRNDAYKKAAEADKPASADAKPADTKADAGKATDSPKPAETPKTEPTPAPSSVEKPATKKEPAASKSASKTSTKSKK